MVQVVSIRAYVFALSITCDFARSTIYPPLAKLSCIVIIYRYYSISADRSLWVRRSLSYLIVGNGIAGATAAEVLRAQDPGGSITMVAEDPFPVYYRPALKDYLAGQVPEEKLWARPRTFYQDQHIRFVPGRVFGVSPQRHMVTLAGGVQLGYDRLLLAGGARARRLSCPGVELSGVSTLRTVRDYQIVLEQIQQPRRVVVCGSGTLALETAEVLNRQGHEVIHLLRL